MSGPLFYGVVVPLAIAIGLAGASHPCSARHVIVVSRIVAMERHMLRAAFAHVARGHEQPSQRDKRRKPLHAPGSARQLN